MPQSAFSESCLQQTFWRLTVEHLFSANTTLRHPKNISGYVCYKLPGEINVAQAVNFSVAFFNLNTCSSYGQTGFLTNVLFVNNFFHPVDWSSNKQRLVGQSSYGSDNLACSDAEEKEFSLTCTLKERGINIAAKHQLYDDTWNLVYIITTLHEWHE